MLLNLKAVLMTLLLVGCIVALPIVVMVLAPIGVFFIIKALVLLNEEDEDDLE